MRNETKHEKILRLLQKQDAENAGKESESDSNADAKFSANGLDVEAMLDLLLSPYLSEDLTEELLIEYAEDRCSPKDRQMVEAMIEVDPRVRDAIDQLRAESRLALAPGSEDNTPKSDFKSILSRIFVRPSARLVLQGGIAVTVIAVLAWIVASQRTGSGASETHELYSFGAKHAYETASGLVAVGTSKSDRLARLLSGELKPRHFEGAGHTLGDANFKLVGKPEDGFVVPGVVTFEWQAPRTEKPTKYQVILKTDGGKTIESTTNDAIPMAQITLDPGVNYQWRVIAETKEGPLTSSEGFFRTLTREETRKAEQNLADPVDQAIELSTLGLKDEALRMLDKVQWKDTKTEAELRKRISNG